MMSHWPRVGKVVEGRDSIGATAQPPGDRLIVEPAESVVIIETRPEHYWARAQCLKTLNIGYLPR